MVLPESLADLKEEQKGDVFIVRIKGRLDAISSPFAEKKICDSVESGQSKILLDMSGVTYLSSAGMRMLLSSTKKLKTYSGRLAVCSTSSNVMDVLKISGFDHVLELFKTEEEALKHL
jgi:anti-sigma B factor antagonist/stage II sporulation protein AA (anti-sigma F factor antagonist)